jgi:hypothetical protein
MGHGVSERQCFYLLFFRRKEEKKLLVRPLGLLLGREGLHSYLLILAAE